MFKVFQKVWRTGNSEYYSSSFQKDGGNHSTWRDNWTYKLPSGEIVNVYNDITHKKLAEEALKASEEKYSTLIEKSSDGIVILNVHSIEFSNNRMCEMSGYPMNEILGKNFLDLVAPEDMERLQASYQDGPVDGTKTENIEVNIISREKKKIPVETNAQIIVYKGRPATMVTIRDITKRKQAEEALKASEQNFRNLIDSSSLGIRISDIDNNTLYANQTLLDIFGYKDIDEVRAKSPQEYYSPESYADYLKMMDKYGRGEIIPDQVDIDIVRKDGTVRHLLTVFKEVFWDGKQQYQTLYNDITENKEIEIALRESEEKYRTIFESANDILMLLDTSGKILDVNKRLTEIGGYDRYELIDKNITELTHIIDEKNMAIVVGNLWKMVNSGEAVTYQVEMIKKNQEPIFIEINAVPIQKWGKVVGVLAILRDITERNKSELRSRYPRAELVALYRSSFA